MYRVYCDDILIHDPLAGDSDYLLFDPVITEEENKAASFTFTIYPNNVGYKAMQRFTSIIEVSRDGTLLFRGRIISDKQTWNNAHEVTCESEFAYLNDTIIRPYKFTSTIKTTLRFFLNRHNEQVEQRRRIYLGTVSMPNPEDTQDFEADDYGSTMKQITDKLVSENGGYLRFRRYAGKNYLDYLSEITDECGQEIRLGENLLEFSAESKGEDVVSCLIPLGKKGEDGNRLTIESVNGGKDYIQDSVAMNQYGAVFAVRQYDDIESASALLAKGRKELKELTKGIQSISLTAADLSLANESEDPFRFLTNVNVVDEKHNVKGRFLITKKTTNLNSAADNKITIGKEIKSISRLIKNRSTQ
ncbi:MAG: phage tail protein [Lachnospiraceae bacterium]|nr:phage tail protein [Lachnospiraceae bacterium]